MSERRTIRTGRNLPVALGVGLALGGLVILTLLTVKVTFLILVAALVGAGLWELHAALASRRVKLPLIPVAAGGAVMVAVAPAKNYPRWPSSSTFIVVRVARLGAPRYVY